MRGIFYRAVMRLAHRFNWHYAPPVYPDGDTMLWCQWCGFRDVIKRRERPGEESAKQIAGSLLREAVKADGRLATPEQLRRGADVLASLKEPPTRGRR